MTRKHAALLASALVLVACGGGRQDDVGASSRDAELGPNGLPAARAGLQSQAAIEDVQCTGNQCLEIGGFTPPFEEPVIYDRSEEGAQLGNDIPFDNPLRQSVRSENCEFDENDRPINCKPGAGTIALLGSDDLLFFSALEGTESAEFSIVAEGGQVLVNDQTRVLGLGADEASWTLPAPIDGGAEDGEVNCLLPGCLLNTDANDPRRNSGSLFCADINALPNGTVLAVGGTNYYTEPGIDTPFNIGVVELEGLNASRIFDPASNNWFQTGDMNFGRWYPTLVSMANGDQFVASGVSKLLKPVYPNEPLQSGRNVVQTETFDLGCGQWTDNGPAAQRSLPLYPRLHLLPNGQVYYNGGGQAFNPFGQAYDQALWNIVGAYNPATQSWTDLGYAGLPLELNELGLGQLTQALNPTNTNIADALSNTLSGVLEALSSEPGSLFDPLVEGLSSDAVGTVVNAIAGGFRGSATSLMMPLKPNPETGEYDQAEFLTAGGVLGAVTVGSPGAFVGVAQSRIDTVRMDGEQMEYRSRLTGALNQGRWYGQAVLLPTGEVMMFSGATHDEVVLPGTAFPITQTELYDPETETWRLMADANKPRTYHNTALLLPDGRVLVGGHAPINTAYAYSLDLTGLGISPNFGRDPSFEIYHPPYVFADRPELRAAPSRVDVGQRFSLSTPDAAQVDEVVLIRRPTLTHLIDGDQRSVVLPIVSRSGGSLEVQMPAQAAVTPAGEYMLFVISEGETGRVPSTSLPVQVNGGDFNCAG